MQQRSRQDSEIQREQSDRRRNPYLVDYEEQMRIREMAGRRHIGAQQPRKPRNIQQTVTAGRPGQDIPERNRNRGSAAARRRRIVRRQRLAVGLWVLGILILLNIFARGKAAVSASGRTDRNTAGSGAETAGGDMAQQSMIQGLPAAVFAAHPDWKEDFLTPNEYSRPGDPLTQVNNIFVHYTANQETSAAQNRSYFEQQKDLHERSVSAHFIIGYEGEIIQCVPLDEIAYAVMTRNQDSISIECCYLAADGSFTQATYDSLISLLAWLTQAYDLETDDILRHYDCGGKKCPLYYTDHPDEWEKLKEDVGKLMEDSKGML